MTDYQKKNKLENKFKIKFHICLLILIIGIVSAPLMGASIQKDSVLTGTNLQASFSRIEAIKEGIGKVFPVRIVPFASMDYGYAAAGFQADVFLLIPALFRVLGLGIGISYKLFLLLVNAATAVIAYLCFGRMFGRKDIGLMGSMLYTWCPYRCSDLYINANLGETVAWTFLPIVILGLVQLYGDSAEEKQSGGSWATLTLGFSLLLLSSTTFFFVAAGAVVLVIICMGKVSLRRQTLLCVGKTVLATGLINAWFLVPMLLRMCDASAVGALIYPNFRMRGMYVTQYLSLFPAAGDGLDFTDKGAVGAQAMGAGAAVVLLVFLYIWCLFVRKISDSVGKRVLCAVLILMIISCNLFPWDLLQNQNMLSSVFLAFLQSPAKWGVVACGGLIWIACRMLWKLSEGAQERHYKIMLAVTAGISFGVILFMESKLLQERGYIYPDTEDWGMVSMQVLAQESMLWRLCELVSAVVMCGFFVMWIVRRRKR